MFFTQSTYFYQVYICYAVAIRQPMVDIIGEIILEPFKLTNDADGFQLLVSKLESFDKNSIIIGLESTAHYGDNLVRYLVAELYQACVLTPIKTCQIRKNNIRKTKTDKVDPCLGILKAF